VLATNNLALTYFEGLGVPADAARAMATIPGGETDVMS
jgi:hypothetical protein